MTTNYRQQLPNDPLWLQHAYAEIGIAEIKGNRHAERVLQYHSCTTLGATDDETPWCSSFVAWVMEQSGVASTRSAASLSWLRWGRQLKTPQRGCLVIFERVGADGVVIPNQGHVGFWLGTEGDFTVVLGGNQSNKVGINNYATKRVVGYRWPSMPHNSTTNMASTGAATGAIVAAAPTIMDVVRKVTDSGEELNGAVDTAREVATGLGIPLGDSAAMVGLLVAVGAALYIIRERNKKINKFGI